MARRTVGEIEHESYQVTVMSLPDWYSRDRRKADRWFRTLERRLKRVAAQTPVGVRVVVRDSSGTRI